MCMVASVLDSGLLRKYSSGFYSQGRLPTESSEFRWIKERLGAAHTAGPAATGSGSPRGSCSEDCGMRSRVKGSTGETLPAQVLRAGRSCQPSWGAQMGSGQIKQVIPLVQRQMIGCVSTEELWNTAGWNQCTAGTHTNLLLTENNALLFAWKDIDIFCLRGGFSQQFQFCFSCQLHSNQIQNPKADSF